MTSNSNKEGRKVALVTGGSRGIGRACVDELAKRGWDIMSVSVSCDTNDEMRSKSRILTRQADVTSAADVKDIFKEIRAEFGRLDGLVNNAGIFSAGMLGMTREDDLERLLDVNVKGAFLNLQMAARLMQRAGQGAIVNISSISGLDGRVGQVAYASSKAAVVGMTVAAARELAPVRVNAIAPGYIETDMTATLEDAERQELVERIGLGRLGDAREVAATVAFLLSEDASYITGQVLRVDGGAWF